MGGSGLGSAAGFDNWQSWGMTFLDDALHLASEEEGFLAAGFSSKLVAISESGRAFVMLPANSCKLCGAPMQWLSRRLQAKLIFS